MGDTTVTMGLLGADLTLGRFADAVQGFARLVEALTAEVGSRGIRWEVDDLEVGSAIATARGVLGNGSDPASIDRVVRSYLEVGQALEHGATVPFAEVVRAPALALAGLLGGEVEAIRFETADAEATLREPPLPEAAPQPTEPLRPSYGAVTGRVQTLSSRSGLRFTLYDTLHDRAVSCYLEPGREETMVDVWGRVATVEGWVSRDAVTGRPTAVRRISAVHPVEEEGELDGYRRARGVLRRRPDAPRAEERLRALRDGE